MVRAVKKTKSSANIARSQVVTNEQIAATLTEIADKVIKEQLERSRFAKM